MKSSALLLLAVLFSMLLPSCSHPLMNSVEDVKSTKYLEFGKYPVGSGKVFVMTQSHISKAYPNEEEKVVIRNISTKLGDVPRIVKTVAAG